MTQLSVFKVLTIGGIPRHKLLEDLGADYYINRQARDVITQALTVVETPREISLACLEVRDLGFVEELTMTRNLFDPDRLAKLGFGLCPEETGPQFFKQCNGGRDLLLACRSGFWIAMKPVVDRSDDLLIFKLGCNGSPWMIAECAGPVRPWYLYDKLLFRVIDE